MKKRGVKKGNTFFLRFWCLFEFPYDDSLFASFLFGYSEVLLSLIISDSSCALKVHFLVMRLLGTVFLVTKPCLVLVLSIFIWCNVSSVFGREHTLRETKYRKITKKWILVVCWFNSRHIINTWYSKSSPVFSEHELSYGNKTDKSAVDETAWTNRALFTGLKSRRIS